MEHWGDLTPSPHQCQHLKCGWKWENLYGETLSGAWLHPRSSWQRGHAGRCSEGRVNPIPIQVPAPQWGCWWGVGGGLCLWGPREGIIHCR